MIQPAPGLMKSGFKPSVQLMNVSRGHVLITHKKHNINCTMINALQCRTQSVQLIKSCERNDCQIRHI